MMFWVGGTGMLMVMIVTSTTTGFALFQSKMSVKRRNRGFMSRGDGIASNRNWICAADRKESED